MLDIQYSGIPLPSIAPSSNKTTNQKNDGLGVSTYSTGPTAKEARRPSMAPNTNINNNNSTTINTPPLPPNVPTTIQASRPPPPPPPSMVMKTPPLPPTMQPPQPPQQPQQSMNDENYSDNHNNEQTANATAARPSMGIFDDIKVCFAFILILFQLILIFIIENECK